MLPSESPFPCHEADLPPLPFPMWGDFVWLAAASEHGHNIIGRVSFAANAEALRRLEVTATQAGVSLPVTFTTFMGSPNLQTRVRSNTDCYLDLSAALIPIPAGGHLIRFLADSQGCVFWYLFLPPNGSDHAVVCSLTFYGTAVDQRPDAAAEFSYVAESFEAFMCRFWLENEVWFADCEGEPMPAVGPEYIERYRSGC